MRAGGGHVLVFANPGDDARTACLRALPSRTRNWVQASSAGSEGECCENRSVDSATGKLRNFAGATLI